MRQEFSDTSGEYVGSSSRDTDPHPRDIVRVKSGLAKRFYEPIILLYVLNTTHKKKPSSTLDPSMDTTQSSELIQCFVNKLALLCDSDKGGGTVTAFTVLQHPDHIEYRFTSNQRDTDGFIRAQNFTTSILHILGGMEEHEKQSVITNILRTSLSFNRPRVISYLKTLKTQGELCASACKNENTNECENEIWVLFQITYFLC